MSKKVFVIINGYQPCEKFLKIILHTLFVYYCLNTGSPYVCIAMQLIKLFGMEME